MPVKDKKPQQRKRANWILLAIRRRAADQYFSPDLF